MITEKSVALALADTLLAREARLASLIDGANWAFGAPLPWIPELCEAILARAGEHFHHFTRNELAEAILGVYLRGTDEDDEDDIHDDLPWVKPEQIKRYCTELPIRPDPPAWLAWLALPDLPSVGDLARWLNASSTEIDWFADKWRVAPDEKTRLQHYHYRWVEKRSGGARLIEIPKERLRLMQQKILRQILDRVPAHPAAHGFRRGHSCVTHAALHIGKRVVIRMDLKDFFPSVPVSRVEALFAKLGYSQTVAGTLARLCVNRTPAGALRERALPWAERQVFRTPHLPQGSPCSPALANLCAYRLDIRLETLAQALGATYSRYADDLVFSGGRDLERALERFHVQVAAIALDEGYRINTRKTRMMRAGVRQQVTGIVINRHANIARDEYDLLKAILTNCVRHGHRSQNRDGRENYRDYLGGKVAYVRMVNPARGDKLWRIYEAIDWVAA
ncbi:MAG: reverse transcriptase family protein [Pseudomonadota bacterium]